MAQENIDLTKSSAAAVLARPGLTTERANAMIQKTQALSTAIDTLKQERLREVLKNVCLMSKDAEDLIGQILLTTEHAGLNKRKRSASNANDGAQTQPKRLRPRYAMCAKCEEEYDVTLNSKWACRWHPGELIQLS